MFIAGRNFCNNVRRLLNIIQLCQKNKIKGMVVSLDAEKAFDCIEWDFLFFTLKEFGLKLQTANFIDWFKLLYNNPLGAVVTNSKCSPYFALGRGT